MRRLLFPILTSMVLLATTARAQQGNMVMISGSGAPTGGCAFLQMFNDTTGGNIYGCSLGAWVKLAGSSGAGTVTGTGTANFVAKWTSTTAIGNSQVQDNGTNPTYSPLGFDITTTGWYAWGVANDGTTGTGANLMACDNGLGTGAAKTCGHTTTATNDEFGIAVSGVGQAPGTTGNVGMCNTGWCLWKMDGTATTNDYAQESTTVDGEGHDVGATAPANGKNFYRISSGCSGAGCLATIRRLTPGDLNASGIASTYKLQVNGTTLSSSDTVNWNGTTPTAPTNGINLTFATSKSGTTDSISAAVVGDGNSGHFLNGTGAFSAPTGGGVTSLTGGADGLYSNSASTGAVTLTNNTQSANTMLAGPSYTAGGSTFLAACNGPASNLGNSVTSVACSTSLTLVAGDTLIVATHAAGNNPSFTVTDPSIGDTFASRQSPASSTSGNLSDIISSAGGTGTPTVAFSPATNRPSVVGLRYSGISAIDASASSNPGAGATGSLSVTTTQANDRLVSCLTTQYLTTAPSLISFGWNQRATNTVNDGTHFDTVVCWDFVAGPIGTYTIQVHAGDTYNANLILAAYKTTGSSPSAIPSFRTLTMPDLPSGVNRVLYSTAATAGTSSLSATTMGAPTTQQGFQFGSYLTQTVVGSSCAGNTTVVVNIIYQDPSAASAQTIALGTYTVTTNGTIGVVPWTSGPTNWTFQAKAGSLIQYSTTYTAGGSCSPAPTVQFYPVLQGTSGQ